MIPASPAIPISRNSGIQSPFAATILKKKKKKSQRKGTNKKNKPIRPYICSYIFVREGWEI